MFEDDDGTSAQDMGKLKILGNFLGRLGPPAWCEAQFGSGYEDRCFEKVLLSAFIRERFTAPVIDVGIKFRPFVISKDSEHVDAVHELLADISVVPDCEEVFRETRDDIPDVWRRQSLDAPLLCRFIPLNVNEWGAALFHAPHLYGALEWICARPDLAPLFAEPSDQLRPFV
jgi:hypothetical protein